MSIKQDYIAVTRYNNIDFDNEGNLGLTQDGEINSGSNFSANLKSCK